MKYVTQCSLRLLWWVDMLAFEFARIMALLLSEMGGWVDFEVEKSKMVVIQENEKLWIKLVSGCSTC